MKHPIKAVLFTAICLAVSAVRAQNPDQSLYTQFDKSIGKGNLGINNGTLHINDLRSANETHRYYTADKYATGSVTYDGQPYTGIALKYDLLKDIIIAKPDIENNSLGINLITEKTASFNLNGKKFVNPGYKNPAVPKFVNGFFEEDIIGNSLILYTKYHKDNIEVLRIEGVYYRYEETMAFVFRYKNTHYRLGSPNDAKAAFPEFEKNIDAFYARNTALERSDKKLFYLTLLKQIDNSLPNEKP